METKFQTDSDRFNQLYPLVKSFLSNDVSEFYLDGKKVRGYRSPDSKPIWLRDHTYQMEGFKYFEKDVVSALEHFLETQSASGRIFDFFKIGDKEDWAEYVRVPAEADVEYLAVMCAYHIWQITGDDKWMKNKINSLEKALNYSMTNKWRWSEKYNLIKRPYTIDTWDFYIYDKADWLKFQIEKDTKFYIFFGDNAGFYNACIKLSNLYRYFRNYRKSSYWKKIADDIKKRTNELCWNGNFYTHMVPETEDQLNIPYADRQLSLSNTYSINRSLTDNLQSEKIIMEYIKRRKKTNAFAEWFSIDPPFQEGIFKDSKLKKGAYINGGIMPLVGGELARAAFDNGYEDYGVDILSKYLDMIITTKESYLWYFPDGKPGKEEDSTSPDALPTDGWGSSAMLAAFAEGLCGIKSVSKLFYDVRLSPRFTAASINQAECQIFYPASNNWFKYSYLNNAVNNKIVMKIESEKSGVDLNVLIPRAKECTALFINGKSYKYRNYKSNRYNYLNAKFEVKGKSEIEIKYS